jgi:hypothetical protein
MIELPTLKQARFVWHFHQAHLPPTSNDPPSLVATVDAYSDRPLEFALRFDKPSNRPNLLPSEFGIKFDGNKLMASNAFLQNLNAFDFPITGSVSISDDRTECFGLQNPIAGACFTSVPFVLNMAEFDPGCPSDVFLFSPLANTPVNWTEPRLRWRNGTFTSLPRTSAMGNVFALGSNLVKYALTSDASQNPSSTIKCSFKVCFMHWFIGPLGTFDRLHSQVDIEYGNSVQVRAVGHRFGRNSTSGSTFIQDFIIDSPGFKTGNTL